MFDELGDGVYRRHYEFLALNVGVVVGDEGVLVIDTRESHIAGEELAADIRTLTEQPVRWVINTHWHWDHAFGNAVFPDAEVWGHRLCRERLLSDPDRGRLDARAWVPEDRWAEIDDVSVIAPTESFEAMASIDIGTHAVRLGYHGRGHTDADIVIHVNDVTFMGDLVEDGGPPYMGDAYLFDWPHTLEVIEGLAGEVVVPGHGSVRDHGWLVSQRHLMGEVGKLLSELISGGRALDDAVAAGPFPPTHMRAALERGLAQTGAR